MKKTLLSILSITLITVLLASNLLVFAASAVTQTGEAKTLGATLPAMDGVIDEIWDQANSYSLDIVKVGSDTGIKSYFKMFWTASTLYVLMVVPDTTPNQEATDDYKKDTVEISIDLSNARTDTYLNDDQMNLRFYGDGAEMLVAKDGNATVTNENVEWGMTKNDGTGYIIEFALKCDSLGVALAANKVIGFDAQVNDNAEGAGERAACYAWNDDGDQVFSNPTYMGEMKFVSEVADIAAVEEEVVAVEESAPATTQSAAPATVVASAPQTSDFSLGFIFVGISVLTAGLLIFKKQRSL